MKYVTSSDPHRHCHSYDILEVYLSLHHHLRRSAVKLILKYMAHISYIIYLSIYLSIYLFIHIYIYIYLTFYSDILSGSYSGIPSVFFQPSFWRFWLSSDILSLTWALPDLNR